VTAVVDMTYSLQYQKIQRYSESWKQTLRDCEPDLDSLPGLRRVTLNHNTDIGDDGAVHLVNVVRDDIFVKGEKWSSCQLTGLHVTATCNSCHSTVK
jgi:centrosomal protein CEP78